MKKGVNWLINYVLLISNTRNCLNLTGSRQIELKIELKGFICLERLAHAFISSIQ